MHILFDLLFQVWRRLSGPWQWWSLWLISSKFMVSVSGVIIDVNGKILLQRHRHWVRDVWGLPGGIVQGGETLEQALAREVCEETGLRIHAIELLRIKSGFKLRMEMYYRACLDASYPQDIHLQKHEVNEARFFDLDELPANLLPAQREAIELARCQAQSAV